MIIYLAVYFLFYPWGWVLKQGQCVLDGRAIHASFASSTVTAYWFSTGKNRHKISFFVLFNVHILLGQSCF